MKHYIFWFVTSKPHQSIIYFAAIIKYILKAFSRFHYSESLAVAQFRHQTGQLPNSLLFAWKWNRMKGFVTYFIICCANSWLLLDMTFFEKMDSNRIPFRFFLYGLNVLGFTSCIYTVLAYDVATGLDSIGCGAINIQVKTHVFNIIITTHRNNHMNWIVPNKFSLLADGKDFIDEICAIND